MNASKFEILFPHYLDQAKKARDENKHHDLRRGLFLELLHDAFNIDQSDIEIERYIQVAGKQISVQGTARIIKGWIDAVFHDLIFEFKRNLKKEEADGKRELYSYLTSIPNSNECVGLLTDGLIFEAYVLDTDQASGLHKIDKINLETVDAHTAYLWLDAYLLRQKDMPPTSSDIVHRFGVLSPTFVTTARILRDALQIFATHETGALEVKRQQWAFHLARVYGSSDVSNEELFIRHTYLCQFAKILVYVARFGMGRAINEIEHILDGKAFEILGVNNIGEHDFFAWVLASEVQDQTLSVFRHIITSLAVYNLSYINEDLLKQLYQNLVEPETRHELGEFYTPDWLAELTLREIEYRPGQSILDPACGSGTFLFTAIRLLVEQGMKGQDLVDFVFGNIMGMDVHPLAVTIAKINYMLAILPHLQLSVHRGQYTIPISMANSLQIPTKSHRIEAENERLAWNINVRWLTRQISEGHDSIWVYVLNNTGRPLYLRYRKFDVVIGNPPWIAYRYIKDPTYQKEIKALTREYELLDIRDTKLNTTMELATLFFEHCRRVYLNTGGTIGFVMPRSILTGAKQHRSFQERGFTRILDLKDVEPLFNVETCVIIRKGDEIYTQSIPTTYFAGILPGHEGSLTQASDTLKRTYTTTDLAEQKMIASPYYYSRFHQGASLVPRNLTFVTSAQENLSPGQLAHISIMRTDPDVDGLAKPPWKGLHLQGHFDDTFLYATLLSTNLIPFGTRRFHLVALPIRIGRPGQVITLPGKNNDERFISVSWREMQSSFTLYKSANEWFEKAEQLWMKNKKETTKETLAQWLNYQNKITKQSATPQHLLISNTSGTNITAAVLNTAALPTINGNKPQGFIADFTTYWYQCSCEEEGYYLSALLNAPSIDGAIKRHQPRGLFGARHITRLPFEVCSIPTFDARNREHQQLATLSQAAHKVIAELDLLEGGVAAARKKARRMAHSYIEQIDAIARYMLGLPSGLYPMLPGRLMAHVSPPRAPMKRFRSLRQRVLHAL